ncbi:MAG: hypothetical protein JWM02_272 [Frankiales bacterium]|nr:hypothetical protein [Frankiales bacterium]
MELSRSVHVQAPALRVWELVSDLPRMGDLSPENAGGKWLGDATGPALGARFRGANRAGWRRWSTDVKVTRCEPGSVFAFAVSKVGLSVAEWRYDIVAEGESACTVTETWVDLRGGTIKVLGALTTGVSDRSAFTVASIEHTLAALRAAVHSPA